MTGERVAKVLAAAADRLASIGVPMRDDVQRGIATVGTTHDMGVRLTAAAEMFPQHTKVSTPGLRSPVLADRPGPVSLDELRAHTGGPGHSASAVPDAADGPDPTTPPLGSGHPHTSSPAGTTKPLPGDAAATGRTGPQLSTSELLYEAAGALRCLTERHERVPSLIDELRDRAAQFAAAGD